MCLKQSIANILFYRCGIRNPETVNDLAKIVSLIKSREGPGTQGSLLYKMMLKIRVFTDLEKELTVPLFKLSRFASSNLKITTAKLLSKRFSFGY